MGYICVLRYNLFTNICKDSKGKGKNNVIFIHKKYTMILKIVYTYFQCIVIKSYGGNGVYFTVSKVKDLVMYCLVCIYRS